MEDEENFDVDSDFSDHSSVIIILSESIRTQTITG